eukprot:340321_1
MKARVVSCWRGGVSPILHLPYTRLMQNSLQSRSKLLCTVSEPSPPHAQLGISSSNSLLSWKKKYSTTYTTIVVQKCGNSEMYFPTPINNVPHRRSHCNANCCSVGSRNRSDRNALSNQFQEYTFSATKARLKEIVKKYGPFAIGTHTAVYAATLGCAYSLIGQGVDITSLVEWLPYYADEDGLEAASGQFAAAYALTALTGPPRAVITVVASPHVTRTWHMHLKPRPAPLIVWDNSGEYKIVKEERKDFRRRKDGGVSLH